MEIENISRVTQRNDFAELSRRVRTAGLMSKCRGYYAVKIAITLGSLAALAASVVVFKNSWWTLLAAGGLAFALAQLGFIAHDAGHRQISANGRINFMIGLVITNLFVGFSFGWWLEKHNRHHAHTNQPGIDPDLHPGALAYTREQVEARNRIGRLFARIQFILLVPLLFLEAINLQVASITALTRRRDKAAILESGLVAVHLAVFLGAPFLVLAPIWAVAFVLLTQTLFGFYLGTSFLTNHVGMPTMSDAGDLGYLRRQVSASRNLRRHLLTGFIFGGLDSQIEHHLFPTMPRANLRRARALVRPFCAARMITYTEESPWRAYKNVFGHLRATGACLGNSVVV